MDKIFASPVIRTPAGTPDRRWLRVSLAALAAFHSTLFAGCLTHRRTVQQAHIQYWEGDFAGAQAALEKALESPKRDEVVLQLDQAMVRLAQGDPDGARELLLSARDALDRGTAFADPGLAATWLTDDNARPYIAEDHEKILVRTLLTLIDLVQGRGDAVAFSHQLGDRIDSLLAGRMNSGRPPDEEENSGTETAVATPTGSRPPDAAPSPLALPDQVREELAVAPFLRAAVRGDSPLHQDDRQRHLQQAVEWRPGSHFLMQEFLAAARHQQAPQGCGTLYVFALVGRGPVRVETIEPVTSQALLVADRILSAIGEYELPPTLAPVRIAAIATIPPAFDSLVCSLNGRMLARTEMIADINRLAIARHAETMPDTLARAVVRRIVKKSVIVAGREQQDSESSLASMAWNAAGVLWEATEQADLRSWSLLPGQIQVLRCDLPAGSHELLLAPESGGRPVGAPPIRCTASISDGQTSFVLVTVSDCQVPGRAYSRK